MFPAMRVGAVNDLYEKVSLCHLFEGRFKRLDKRRGKLVNKADRVGQEEFLSSGHSDAPNGRIQSGKEHVRFKDLPLIRLAFRSRIG